MSISPILPIAIQAGALALEQASNLASNASSFAQVLLNGADGDPAEATVDAPSALESFRKLLFERLPADVDTKFKMRIEQGPDGTLKLAGVHVDQQRINEALAQDDVLRQAFEELARELRRGEGSPDPGALELRLDDREITYRFALT